MAVTKVVMPKLSEAMETGKLLRWLKQEGDRVSGGDIIAEIETDKADIELEAFGSGVLRKLLATPGTAVPVGGLIAVIADPNDDISALVGGGAPATTIRTRPRPGTSPSQWGAASSTAATTAGAAHMIVTPCRSTRRRISVPSTLRSTTWGTPMAAIVNGIPQPLQWNIGSVCR